VKKVCLVVSHLGSGSGDLVATLNSHPQCEIYESGARYDSPATFRWLFRAGHKCRDASAVYGDHLLFNASISSRDIYGSCHMLFVIRPARHSLNEIVAKGYSPAGASAYYRFRLRRICEAARRATNSALLTWDDLAKQHSMRTIEDLLGLSSTLKNPLLGSEAKDACPESMIEECQDAYDRYYYYLSKLKLRRPIDKVA
jgi:hypothetical protein